MEQLSINWLCLLCLFALHKLHHFSSPYFERKSLNLNTIWNWFVYLLNKNQSLAINNKFSIYFMYFADCVCPDVRAKILAHFYAFRKNPQFLGFYYSQAQIIIPKQEIYSSFHLLFHFSSRPSMSIKYLSVLITY